MYGVVNVGKYTSPMDALGIVIVCVFRDDQRTEDHQSTRIAFYSLLLKINKIH